MDTRDVFTARRRTLEVREEARWMMADIFDRVWADLVQVRYGYCVKLIINGDEL